MDRRWKFIMFLCGLGSQLQIVASLSFTEVFMYIAGPILFFREYSYLRRNGIMPIFLLSLCVVANAALSIFSNHTPFQFALRGMAVVCLLPCVIVTVHWLLRHSMMGFKWWLVGAAISGVLCVFCFQKSVEVAMLARGATNSGDIANGIMGGTLFWIGRGGSFLNMITQGWYIQCPILVSIFLPVGFSVYALFTSVSGRSSSLAAVCSAIFVLIGGKSSSRIYRGVCKRFWLLCIVGLVAVFVFKCVYEYTASNGILGEEARTKYERQTKGSKSLKQLLLGGRMESFLGLLACVDKPIVGFGPWAIDEYGYTKRFLMEYADAEDFNNYIDAIRYRESLGLPTISLISCHSYITMFWLWYGMFGLLFWIYVLYAIVRYLRQDCYAVPHWYMWLAAGTPAYVWSIFFSPYADRVGSMMFVVAILLVRSVRRGLHQMPVEMTYELSKLGFK